MDRTSVAVLLCLGSAWSVPRDNSDITYVRIQPIMGQHAPRGPLATLRESRIENLPLTFGSGSDNVRRIRSDTETTPAPEEATTLAPKESTTLAPKEPTTSTPEEPKTESETVLKDSLGPEEYFYEKRVPGPRFYSKLSYFSKPVEDVDSPLTNLVGGGGRRKFRSRCRCERIWNCPKLQISVARCPNEYFLCCF